MARRPPSDPSMLLAEGQEALTNGDRLRAQALFRAVLRQDPNHEEAWLWLGGAVDPAEAVVCLQHVLQINPDNEQALEGLEWIRRTYGIVEIDAADKGTEAVPVDDAPADDGPPQEAIRDPFQRQWERPRTTVSPRVTEWTFHIAAIGAMVGLISLVVALRATALLFGRNAIGGFGWSKAVAVVIVAATTHSAALVLAWRGIGSRIARLRNDHPHDRSQSLADTGRALLPGYLTAPALFLVLLGVGWSQQRWLPVVVAVIILLSAAVLWSVKRLMLLADPLRIVRRGRRGHWAIELLPPAVIGLLAMAAASALIRWLLHRF